MATPVRQTFPGATYLVTRRCTQRRFLLTPREKVDQIVGYAAGVAAQRYGVEVHAVCALGNHVHLVATDPDGRISDFARDFLSLVARCMNARLRRAENFWDSGRLSLVRLCDRAQVQAKLVYTTCNPVLSGLVERSVDWPGLRTRPSDVLHAPRRFKRPGGLLREKGKMPKEVELPITVPPCLKDLGKKRYVEWFRSAVDRCEASVAARMEADGRRFLGVDAVLRQRRDGRPRTPARRNELSPDLAATDPKRREAEVEDLMAFRHQYHEARAQWLKGELPVSFPAGTTLMAAYPGVVCGAPPGPARLAA